MLIGVLVYILKQEFYMFILNTSANRIKHDLYCQYNFVNSMGSQNVCTHWMYQYYVLYSAWWWLSEPKHVAEFLIFITNICCVYWLNINYYIIAKHNGMAAVKKSFSCVFIYVNLFFNSPIYIYICMYIFCCGATAHLSPRSLHC
jgi:hypothetical protein